jgi:hypothetical protein
VSGKSTRLSTTVTSVTQGFSSRTSCAAVTALRVGSVSPSNPGIPPLAIVCAREESASAQYAPVSG